MNKTISRYHIFFAMFPFKATNAIHLMNLALTETFIFPSAFLAMRCGYECRTMRINFIRHCKMYPYKVIRNMVIISYESWSYWKFIFPIAFVTTKCIYESLISIFICIRCISNASSPFFIYTNQTVLFLLSFLISLIIVL